MKQLLILFALLPVFLIGQNLPQKTSIEVMNNPSRIVSTMHYEGKTWTGMISAYDHALQDSVKKWEIDDRIYRSRALDIYPDTLKPTWKYERTLRYDHDRFRLQRDRPIWITEPRKGMMCDPGIKIVGDDGVQITDLDNGMIRIEKIESETEFWKRKYTELLKQHLEIINRQ